MGKSTKPKLLPCCSLDGSMSKPLNEEVKCKTPKAVLIHHTETISFNRNIKGKMEHTDYRLYVPVT